MTNHDYYIYWQVLVRNGVSQSTANEVLRTAMCAIAIEQECLRALLAQFLANSREYGEVVAMMYFDESIVK